MTSLHARTSKAAIVFALSVFSGLMTRKNTRLFTNLASDDVRVLASANRGYNQSQAFDLLVEQCVNESESNSRPSIALPSLLDAKAIVSANAQNRRANNADKESRFLLPNVDPTSARNAKAIVLANAQIQRATNAEKELSNLLSRVNWTKPRLQHRALEAVWFAVCAVYAVLRHLIEKVYNELMSGDVVRTAFISPVVLRFSYRMFVSLFTAVTRALALTKGPAPNAMNKAPRLVLPALTQEPPRRRQSVTIDELGRMVLSVLVVKERLEAELEDRQQALVNGTALLENLAKSACANNSGAFDNNVVEMASNVGRLCAQVKRNTQTKQLANQIVKTATKLQADLESLAQPTATVHIPPELQDAVLQLLHRVGLSNANRRV
jgi:hypothetical protein